jgi:hypothetical protein
MQSAQSAMREKSERWLAGGQELSDRVSLRVTELAQASGFWFGLAVMGAGGTAFRHRRLIRTRLRIWRIRRGRGLADGDVVEHLFYRAIRTAGPAPARNAAQTWREWIIGLPDPQRRSILEKALIVFEKSKYGGVPASAADFALLEETIRELKL